MQEIVEGIEPSTAIAGERRTSLRALLQLLRPQQWVKNVFVLAPLFFTPGMLNAHTAGRILIGGLCFCALASAVYVLNDLMDRDSDRLHPEKCRRPLASGSVSVGAAVCTMALLAAGALWTAAWLSSGFAAIAALYLAVNIGYSTYLKRVSILDVMLVALGYVLRLYAGAALIDVTASVWIVTCTGLVSLFIALAKRRDDLVRAVGTTHRPALGGYTKPFLDAAIAITLSGVLVSYLIYTADAGVMQRFGTDRLYVTTPFVIMGVLRYLQIALVEERSGSPTTILLTDRFLILCVLAWAASFAALIYG
jgi:4-hydroxybenzoate polyprenyltransferase